MTEPEVRNRMSSRTNTFYDFKQFSQGKDSRTMDEICNGDERNFKLQVQQEFLRDYIAKNPSWDRLVLYHQIGSGKTCTAITLAEKYMKMTKKGKVTVILPARLRTNFFDELVSPCGMEKYISQKDFAKFHNPSTSKSAKARIKKAFMTAIANNYDIMSYEKFRGLAIKAENLRRWASEFTKDKLIIVDEAHNVLTDAYDTKKYKEICEKGRYIRCKGSNTVAFKYILENAHPSCKIIMLTATPIFDNIKQLKELVAAVKPGIDVKKSNKLSNVIDHLRGKVSFFPGTSPNAYPKVEYEDHLIPMSKTQEVIIQRLHEENEDDDKEEGEAFMSKERQASLACLPGRATVSKNIDKVLAKQSEYCPKIKELVANIRKLRGKHLVYSTFVASGVNVIKAALEKLGWVDVKTVYNDETEWKKHSYKVFGVWDGKADDADKTLLKSIANRKDNLDGKLMRVVIGSPSIKEGVSFKHIQHMHLMDPVWNSSAKLQIEGRAIRFCSHVDIPKDHDFLKRTVTTHIYKLTPRAGGVIEETADQLIYDKIIPRKEQFVKAGEDALKKVAIDYYLFRRMYSKTKESRVPPPPPRPPLERVLSDVALIENVSFTGRKKPIVKASTCPKPRRPDDDDNCPANHVLKVNPHGDKCCYKVRGSGKTETDKASSCPKPRRPDASGKCVDGYTLRVNNNGDPCCYATSRKRKQA